MSNIHYNLVWSLCLSCTDFGPVMFEQVVVLGGSIRTRTESLEQIPSRQNQGTGRAVENTYSFV